MSPRTLEAGGFQIDINDMRSARNALHKLFDWIVDTAEIVLTDKPFVSELDKNTAVARALQNGCAVFTGPMIRDIPERCEGSVIRDKLGLSKGPIMVGSVGGTTMFLENKKSVIESYIGAYLILKQSHPNLQFVLLGREKVEVPDDVVVLPYLPDWMPLLQEADVLISAPGWITVSEVAAMRVPTVFVLSSLSEYHEIEASRRLKILGFPSLVAPDANELACVVGPLIGNRDDTRPTPAQLAVAPDGSGTRKAAYLLASSAQAALARSRKSTENVADLPIIIAAKN